MTSQSHPRLWHTRALLGLGLQVPAPARCRQGVRPAVPPLARLPAWPTGTCQHPVLTAEPTARRPSSLPLAPPAADGGPAGMCRRQRDSMARAPPAADGSSIPPLPGPSPGSSLVPPPVVREPRCSAFKSKPEPNQASLLSLLPSPSRQLSSDGVDGPRQASCVQPQPLVCPQQLERFRVTPGRTRLGSGPASLHHGHGTAARWLKLRSWPGVKGSPATWAASSRASHRPTPGPSPGDLRSLALARPLPGKPLCTSTNPPDLSVASRPSQPPNSSSAPTRD